MLLAMTHLPPLRQSSILTVFLLASAAHAFAGADIIDDRSSLLLGESLFVDGDAGRDQLAGSDALASQDVEKPFGSGNTWWWTVGAGLAGGDETAHVDYNGFISFDYFFVKNLEIQMEFDGWFFNQQGRDSGAGGFQLQFRYHFYNKGRLSIFAEGGAGFVLATQPVPALGTDFNFTPRGGMGLTFRLSKKSRTRLVLGARWQHISNARAFGAGKNPGRDNAMVYAGVMFPF